MPDHVAAVATDQRQVVAVVRGVGCALPVPMVTRGTKGVAGKETQSLSFNDYCEM